jgi:lambda family phage portal protein
VKERFPKIEPNLIDRVVSYFDPIRGASRHRARVMLALTGGYTGARHDRRPTQDWRTTSGSADADILPDLPTLRDRSRDLSRNAPLASGALSTVITNVVGTGLEPQSVIDREALGLDDPAVDEWQKAAEREWWLWAGNQECDITRTQDFAGLQNVAFRSVLESGDLLVIKRFVERPGSPYGLKLQLVEADRLRNPQIGLDVQKLDNGNIIAGGVELDPNGAPVAYHILPYHPGDYSALILEPQRLEAFGAESGERIVLHLFTKLRPGQSRGVPYLAPVIEALKQLARYSEAEIMAAVISSMFTTFVKTETGEGLGLAQPSTETGAQASDEDYKLAPGAILDLLPNEDVSFANPMRPNSSFDPFVQSILSQIGTALELPFEVLNKRFTASYSASRAAMLEAWRFFKTRRQWLAMGFCQPAYEAVITEAVASGRLEAPGFFEDPIIREAWLSTQWTGPPQGQIDPESEISAAAQRINLGVSTLAEVTAELTGGDWELKNKQRAKERRLRIEAGLDSEEIAERIKSEPTVPQPPQQLPGMPPPASVPPPPQQQGPPPRESPARQARRREGEAA